MPKKFFDKAKQISELYQEIERMERVLKNLTEYKSFHVPSLGSYYKVTDLSVVEATIQAYSEFLQHKKDQLNELVNGEYDAVVSRISAVLTDKEK